MSQTSTIDNARKEMTYGDVKTIHKIAVRAAQERFSAPSRAA